MIGGMDRVRDKVRRLEIKGSERGMGWRWLHCQTFFYNSWVLYIGLLWFCSVHLQNWYLWRIIRVSLTWIDLNVWVRLPTVGLCWNKFNQGIITQRKDEVTQCKLYGIIWCYILHWLALCNNKHTLNFFIFFMFRGIEVSRRPRRGVVLEKSRKSSEKCVLQASFLKMLDTEKLEDVWIV